MASQNSPISVKIHAQSKNKDQPSDALPNFLQSYASYKRVGTLLKDNYTGKMVDEWNKTVDDSSEKPELVDMTPAVSTFMAVKDQEEQVIVLMAYFQNNQTQDFLECYKDSWNSYQDATSTSHCPQVGDYLGSGSEDYPRSICCPDRVEIRRR